MRKVVLSMATSLDGYVATTDGGLDWIFPNMDSDVQRWLIDRVSQADTHLIGRVNYVEQAGYWPTASEEIAPLINAAAKVVFSSTLTSADWSNSRLAELDVAGEIAALKSQPGKDILVPGGARFAQYVAGHGLVDEYRIMIYPVVLGSGLPLFREPVRLAHADTVTFASGAVALTYRPA